MKIKRLFEELQLHTNPKKYCKKHGIKVGKDTYFTGKMNFGSEPYLVEIGNHVLIVGATFITHEGAHWVLKGLDPNLGEIFGYGRIKVCDNVYIGHQCTILRGVTIGPNTIVGACSLVNKSLEPNCVYAGVPAKKICTLDEFKEKFLKDMPEFDLKNYKENKMEEVLKIVDQFKHR